MRLKPNLNAPPKSFMPLFSRQRIHASLRSPAGVTFVASLILSFIMLYDTPVNRDGMLYVRASRAFLEGGFDAARAFFNWPLLPILMGVISRLTGLDAEHAGHLLNALFMAGTCSLMVASVHRKSPEIAWFACLVVLAMPGFNEYRNELLREYGCWFFVMLSFWMALRWSENPGWKLALGIQAALLGSALFRSESLALFPALILWQVFDAPREARWRRLMMLGALPAAGGIVLLLLYLGGHFSTGNRLAGDVGRFNLARFDAKAQVLASALIEYARGQARAILLFGSLALIPIKLVQKLGLFLVPLIFLLSTSHARTTLARYSLFAGAIAAHLLVLAVFVTDVQFLAGRYVGLILLFSVPFVATGLWLITQRYPRWRYPILSIVIVMMLANVVSISQGKKHYVAAGKWLSNHATETSQVYIDSGRTAYFANWEKIALAKRHDLPAIEESVRRGQHTLYILEISRKDPPAERWLESIGLRVVERFGAAGKDSVIIATHDIKKP
jgi:hypothetical protein